MIGGGVVTLISSASSGRVALDRARNREYAADGAIEGAIAQVRLNMTNGQAATPCSTLPPSPTLNGVQVQVTCTFVPAITTTRYLQRNVIFTARCAAVHVPECPDTNVIIRAAGELRVTVGSHRPFDHRNAHVHPGVERQRMSRLRRHSPAFESNGRAKADSRSSSS